MSNTELAGQTLHFLCSEAKRMLSDLKNKDITVDNYNFLLREIDTDLQALRNMLYSTTLSNSLKASYEPVYTALCDIRGKFKHVPNKKKHDKATAEAATSL